MPREIIEQITWADKRVGGTTTWEGNSILARTDKSKAALWRFVEEGTGWREAHDAPLDQGTMMLFSTLESAKAWGQRCNDNILESAQRALRRK